MFCAFVDFEKAFDTVWRDALWYKLLLNHIWIKWIAFIFVYWFYITYNPNVGHYTRVKNCIKYLLISREKPVADLEGACGALKFRHVFRGTIDFVRVTLHIQE
jgi:hypothetical protein